MKKQAQPKLIVTYYTTAEVMATEKACWETGLPGRIIPVPRALTSDCGMAWCADPQDEPVLRKLLEDEKIEFSGIHELML